MCAFLIVLEYSCSLVHLLCVEDRKKNRLTDLWDILTMFSAIVCIPKAVTSYFSRNCDTTHTDRLHKQFH